MNTQLKIGQRWRTRSGAIAYVHAANDGRNYCPDLYPYVARIYGNGTDCAPNYTAVTSEGRFYNDIVLDKDHPSDLVELLDAHLPLPAAPAANPLPPISWPSLDLNTPAGDSTQATTFAPLPISPPAPLPPGAVMIDGVAYGHDTRAGMVYVTVLGDGTVVSRATPSLDALAGVVDEPMPPEVAEMVAAANPGTTINPKDAIGASKLPLHLWPAEATALGCLGMLEGALKYGRANFVGGQGVIASIYIDAAMRHLLAWFEGEENAHDTGTPHLANALATIAIVVKCLAHGKLIDDRNYGTLPDGARYRAFVEELTPHVKRLKAMFADKSPKHFTIGDVVVDRKRADDSEGGLA